MTSPGARREGRERRGGGALIRSCPPPPPNGRPQPSPNRPVRRPPPPRPPPCRLAAPAEPPRSPGGARPGLASPLLGSEPRQLQPRGGGCELSAGGAGRRARPREPSRAAAGRREHRTAPGPGPGATPTHVSAPPPEAAAGLPSLPHPATAPGRGSSPAPSCQGPRARLRLNQIPDKGSLLPGSRAARQQGCTPARETSCIGILSQPPPKLRELLCKLPFVSFLIYMSHLRPDGLQIAR